MKDGPVRVGIIGSQFQADCHAAAIGMIEDDMSLWRWLLPRLRTRRVLPIATRFRMFTPTTKIWRLILMLKRSPLPLPTHCIAK